MSNRWLVVFSLLQLITLGILGCVTASRAAAYQQPPIAAPENIMDACRRGMTEAACHVCLDQK